MCDPLKMNFKSMIPSGVGMCGTHPHIKNMGSGGFRVPTKKFFVPTPGFHTKCAISDDFCESGVPIGDQVNS